MSKLVYLAGPVDQAGKTFDNLSGIDWGRVRQDTVTELHDIGYDVFRPDRAFDAGLRSGAVQDANNAVIRQSAAVVALLPAGVPTLGTPVEVEYAMAQKMPVLVVTDLSGSVQVAHWESRGAVVCGPDRIGVGLLELSARMTARGKPMAQAFRDAAESLAAIGGSRPLIFQPVAGVGTEIDVLPRRGYADDAGLDLIVSEDCEVGAYEFRDVPCGVKVDIPHGYWGMITGRSSTLRKRGLLVSTGVIDAGWTGELFAGVKNLGPLRVDLKAGERVAQLILLPAPVTNLRPEWGRVPKKARGEQGFGSTGA